MHACMHASCLASPALTSLALPATTSTTRHSRSTHATNQRATPQHIAHPTVVQRPATPATTTMPVDVVLGAGGNTGLAAVHRLLAVHGGAAGTTVRAVVRDPAKYADKLPSQPGLEVVAGDVCDEASLRTVLAGARGVVFAASGKGFWTPAEVDFEVRKKGERRLQVGALALRPGRGAACWRRRER